MGMLDRSATKRKTAPVPAPVGAWGNDGDLSTVGLDTSDGMWLACMHAMLTLDDKSATSAWRAPDQTRQNQFSAFFSATNVILDADRVNTTTSSISAGGSGPLVASKDWTAAFDPESQTITVAQLVTKDDKVINDKLPDEARQRLAHGVAARRYGLRTAPGAPDQRALVVTVPNRRPDTYSPFQNDYLSQPPSWFTAPFNVLLGVAPDPDALQSVRNVFAPFAQPDGSFALTAGSADLPLRAALRDSDDGSLLAVEWDQAPSDTAARTGAQVMLRLLALQAEALTASWPSAATALRDTFASLNSGWTPTQTGESGGSWTKKVARPTLELAPGAAVPVVMTIMSSRSVAGPMQEASFWLPQYTYRWTSGLSKRARENPTVLTRRVGTVRGPNGEPTPWVRFAEVENSTRGVPADIRPWNSRFWELTVSATKLDDGRTRSRVAVSGLTRVGEAVAYGAELVEYLSVLAALTTAGDPDATVTTTYLTI